MTALAFQTALARLIVDPDFRDAVRGQGAAPPTPAAPLTPAATAGPLSLAAEMGTGMEIAGSLEALSQLAQVLAGLPGEKVLVYVAVGEGSFTDWPGPMRPSPAS